MLNNNKKGQVINDVFMFIFASFFYFLIGYPIFNSIIENVWLSQNPTGLYYYIGVIAPFLPILGLMWWGYVLAQDVSGGGAIE